MARKVFMNILFCFVLFCFEGSTLIVPPGMWIASFFGENTYSSHQCLIRSANSETNHSNNRKEINIPFQDRQIAIYKPT